MPNPVSCPRCEAVNTAGAPFCSLCGSPLTAPAVPSSPTAPAPIPTREPSEALVLALAIFGLVGCGPISAIPALILARRQRAANPQSQLPIASYWISIIALGFTALTVAAMVLIFALGAQNG